MTELATPPTEQREGLTRISHWIGGKSVQGASGRTGPVFDPHGRCIGRFTSIWRREAAGWRIVFDKGGPCEPA